jgi:hypothetical protein
MVPFCPVVATLSHRRAHSSSGLGHRPLTAAARVRIPYAPFSVPGLAGSAEAPTRQRRAPLVPSARTTRSLDTRRRSGVRRLLLVKPIRFCSSARKRAQSARRSSETKSPGSSGSGDGDESASWLGPDLTAHLGVWKLWKTLVMKPQAHARAIKRRVLRLYDAGRAFGITKRGRAHNSSERARTSPRSPTRPRVLARGRKRARPTWVAATPKPAAPPPRAAISPCRRSLAHACRGGGNAMQLHAVSGSRSIRPGRKRART